MLSIELDELEFVALVSVDSNQETNLSCQLFPLFFVPFPVCTHVTIEGIPKVKRFKTPQAISPGDCVPDA